MSDFGQVMVNGLQHKERQPGYDISANIFIGFPVMGNGIKHKSGGNHTIQLNTHNFTGNIVIEGTIDTDPNTATYVPCTLIATLDSSESTLLPLVGGNVRAFYTVNGQYTWLRANVSNIGHGTLNFIKMAL